MNRFAVHTLLSMGIMCGMCLAFDITTRPGTETLSRTAYNPVYHEYLVVWEDTASTISGIYAQRVDEDGGLTGSPFVVEASSWNRKRPDVAYNPVDSKYLVVYSREYNNETYNDDIRCIIMDYDGSNKQAVTIADGNIADEENPMVVYDATVNEFFVVWQEDLDNVTNIIGAHVASDGTVGTPFVIDSGTQDCTFPAVACSGGNYMVVWEQEKVGGVGHYVMGQLIDYETLDGSQISVWTPYYDQHSPRIAYNSSSNEYCIVIQIEVSAGNANRILGRKYSASGEEITAFWISDTTDSRHQLYPDIDFCSQRDEYVATWQYGYESLALKGVLGRRIGSGFFTTIGDPIPVYSPMFSSGFLRYYPAICFSDNELCLVTWETSDDIQGWLGTFWDTTPPTVELDTPEFLGCVCDDLNFPITGVAYDDDGDFDYYILEYATTTGGWNSIGTFTTPVPSSGLLGSGWDTTGLSTGYYYLRLTGYNEEGLQASDQVTVWVDKVYSSHELVYPQNNGVIGRDVCIKGTAWDHLCHDRYTVEYREVGGTTWLPVEPGTPYYTENVLNDPLAHWDTITNGIPDGEYDLRFEAFDTCGNTATETIQVIVDNTLPTAEITSPAACAAVGHTSIIVYGSVDDDNLAGWRLEYNGNDSDIWHTIAQGTAPVSGKLGDWDTSNLDACAYVIRLVAWDSAVLHCNSLLRNEKQDFVTVDVGQNCTLEGDIDCDGDVDLEDLRRLSSHWLLGT